MPPAPLADEANPTQTMHYSHRPRAFAKPLDLVLDHACLIASRGKTRETMHLAAIAAISLQFTPKNASYRCFSCKIAMKDGRRLTFHNVNWVSLVSAQRQDPEFRALVLALIERASRANPQLVRKAGVSRLHFAAMALFGVGLFAALVAASVFAAQHSGPIVAFGAISLVVYLGFWLRDYLRRNQPGEFVAEAVPDRVLPAAS